MTQKAKAKSLYSPVISALKPPLVRWAAEAARLRQRGGISYRSYSGARSSRINLVPASVDLTSGLIIDLGANAGDWTAGLLQAVPSARVLAVEPFPEAKERVMRRFASNRNVRVDGRAVGARSGTSDFHMMEDDVFGSILEPDPAMQDFYEGAQETGVMTVPTVSLDELVAGEPVSLLKIDVQGAEMQVFEGGERTLENTQAILIEANFAPHYRGGSQFSEIDVNLTRRGFMLWDLTNLFKGPHGRLLWADAVYVRS